MGERIPKKLQSGVILAELYPKVAARSCDDCQKWQYDEETGDIKLWIGEPLPRLRPDLVPCRVTSCPKGTPENSRELSPQNQRAWWHYQQCRAVGQWPDDPIVRRNAAVIDRAERLCRDIKRQELVEYIKAALRIR